MDVAGLALLRGTHLAATLSLFGAAVFRAVVLPGFPLRRLIAASLVTAVLAGLVWLGAETATMANGFTFAALREVVTGTRFGELLVLRLVLCLAGAGAMALPGQFGRFGAVALLGGAVALEGAIGHAAAMGGTAGLSLGLTVAVHVLSAGAWLGGLLPLFLAVSTLPQLQAARAAGGFTALGLVAVLLIAATATAQAIALIGSLGGLLGTDYGRVALAKLTAFVGLLVLALVNRLRLTPALAHGAPHARRDLRRGIAVEAVLGLLVVLAAGTLASLQPGVHEEPVWPFAWRPSLAAFAEPGLRDELIGAAIELVGAIALVVAALRWRRARLPALAAAALLVWRAAGSADLLLVPAYPTSYDFSPTGFSADSIAQGDALYPPHCAACHGPTGAGNGPQAATLKLPPADLTAAHLWAQPDGELFWWIAHGMTGPEGSLVMPGFSPPLSDDEVWALIDFIRASNAGLALATQGAWPVALPAPDADLTCPDPSIGAIGDLRGRMLRIVATPDAIRVQAGTMTCDATDPAARSAYALVAGVPEAALTGTAFVVDAAGTLRRRFLPGAPDMPRDEAGWTALLDAVARTPVTGPALGMHRH